MTHLADDARGRDLAARWCSLAERRLEYLTELFETGRWRRFHSEHAFLENIQEAKAAVETWRALSTPRASPGNAAIRVAMRNGAPSVAAQPQPAPILAKPARDIPADVLVGLESQLVGLSDIPSVPVAPDLDEMPLSSFDLDVMRQRYPLLRNAL